MATIYEDIKNNLGVAAPELNSTSKMALFDTIARAVAITCENTVTELNNTKIIIDNSINSQRFGKSGYYIDKALAFQIDDTLIIDSDTFDYVYATIDEDKKIIKQAAFEMLQSGGSQILYLKVAALDTETNKLRKLTDAEKTQFDAYMINFEIPGIQLNKISLDANEFNFNCLVTYFATSNLTEIKSSVTGAFNTFRNNYQLNGVLFTNDVETFIKTTVAGVRNVQITNTTIKNPTTDEVTAYSGSTVLGSGYFDYITDFQNNISYVAI